MYDFNISNTNEGENFEQEIASALISVFPKTLYKNTKYIKGENYKEFTDIFAYYEYGSFLIEAKDTSIIKSGFYISKERRILNVQKQVKKAIKQLTGAAKVFIEGTEIYTNDNKKINVNRTQPPHCIILITEFIHNGDWSEVENLLFDAVNKTNVMFHLMDLKEFIELLKASSGRAEIMDYNLMQRFKYVIENYKHV